MYFNQETILSTHAELIHAPNCIITIIITKPGFFFPCQMYLQYIRTLCICIYYNGDAIQISKLDIWRVINMQCLLNHYWHIQQTIFYIIFIKRKQEIHSVNLLILHLVTAYVEIVSSSWSWQKFIRDAYFCNLLLSEVFSHWKLRSTTFQQITVH